MIGIIVVIAVMTLHKSPSTGNAAATSTTAAPAPSALAPDCGSQVISWRDNGGSAQLEAVITDMGKVQSSATSVGTDLSAHAKRSHDESSLRTAAASLQADARTAQTNLPPSCVPHLRADYTAALNDASKAAIDGQDAVSEMGSESYSVATDDVNAASVAITVGGKKFQSATHDL
jgi:hypothetical protein